MCAFDVMFGLTAFGSIFFSRMRSKTRNAEDMSLARMKHLIKIVYDTTSSGMFSGKIRGR